MEEIGGRRRVIRGALWLWCLFGLHAEQSEAEWWPVAGGAEISDERIAVLLDVSATRARKWRVRLEQLGMLRSELTRPRTRRFWIFNVDGQDAQRPPQTIPSPLSNLVN